VAELRKAAEVIDLFGGETQVEQVIDHLGEAGGEDEIAVRRETADGEFENGFLGGLAGLEVAGGHSEFVEVGEESVHGRLAGGTACPTLHTLHNNVISSWA